MIFLIFYMFCVTALTACENWQQVCRNILFLRLWSTSIWLPLLCEIVYCNLQWLFYHCLNKYIGLVNSCDCELLDEYMWWYDDERYDVSVFVVDDGRRISDDDVFVDRAPVGCDVGGTAVKTRKFAKDKRHLRQKRRSTGIVSYSSSTSNSQVNIISFDEYAAL